jgi:hypothetical protein
VYERELEINLAAKGLSTSSDGALVRPGTGAVFVSIFEKGKKPGSLNAPVPCERARVTKCLSAIVPIADMWTLAAARKSFSSRFSQVRVGHTECANALSMHSVE